MNDKTFEKNAEETAAFQKIWTDSMSKMMQSAFAGAGASPPPEMLRQIRSAMFVALAQAWEEFMRSPQFLEGMKQWMDSAVTFRKMTNDFMSRVRNEMQAPSRDDMDSIILAVRHMERRILDRLDGLSAEVSGLNGHGASAPGRRPAAKDAETKSKPPETSGRPAPANSKEETP